MKGKKGLIMGVANERSIAWGISQKLAEAGAELAFTYLGDALKKELYLQQKNLIKALLVVTWKKREIIKLFKDIKTNWGELDFVVHAVVSQINQNYLENT